MLCASHTLLDALQICSVKLCCSIISSDVAEVSLISAIDKAAAAAPRTPYVFSVWHAVPEQICIDY